MFIAVTSYQALLKDRPSAEAAVRVEPVAAMWRRSSALPGPKAEGEALGKRRRGWSEGATRGLGRRCKVAWPRARNTKEVKKFYSKRVNSYEKCHVIRDTFLKEAGD